MKYTALSGGHRSEAERPGSSGRARLDLVENPDAGSRDRPTEGCSRASPTTLMTAESAEETQESPAREMRRLP